MTLSGKVSVQTVDSRTSKSNLSVIQKQTCRSSQPVKYLRLIRAGDGRDSRNHRRAVPIDSRVTTRVRAPFVCNHDPE